MEEKFLCSHCQTEAVAELDGDYLCVGCLMNIVMCLEEPPLIHPIEKDRKAEGASTAPVSTST